MIDSLYYLSREIQERCENSFVTELQNKLPKALLFITKPEFNSATGRVQILRNVWLWVP